VLLNFEKYIKCVFSNTAMHPCFFVNQLTSVYKPSSGISKILDVFVTKTYMLQGFQRVG